MLQIKPVLFLSFFHQHVIGVNFAVCIRKYCAIKIYTNEPWCTRDFILDSQFLFGAGCPICMFAQLRSAAMWCLNVI